jgi:hypothetical protein
MHEAIVPDRIDCKLEFCEGLEVSHRPDVEKSRKQYNQMIEDAYNEYKNSRYSIYYFFELIKNSRNAEAIKVLKLMIKNKETPKIDKALAYMALGTLKPRLKVFYFLKSLSIYPTRETYTQLAINYYEKEKWFRTYYFGKKADSIKIKTRSILKIQTVWGFLPFNIMSAAKHNMWLFKWSKSYKLNKKEINLASYISHKFKLFND